MPTYRFEALNSQGTAIRGVLAADGEREAARNLDRRGLTVLLLEPDTLSAAPTGRRTRRMRLQDLIVAFHELSTMLQSGVALAEAVSSQTRSSHHPRLVAAFESVSTALRRGQGFSAALATTALPLPGYFLTLVRAGEQSGSLAQALADGVAQMEYDDQVRAEARQALTYPAVLVAAGLGAVLLMFTFVVPKFAPLLERGGDLPLLASAVLHGGLFVRDHFVWILVALGLAALAMARVLSRPGARARLYERVEHWPVVGPWRVEAETAGWAKVLGTLLANRVPLLDALGLAKDSTVSPQRRARLDEAARSVRAGIPLADALEEQGALTATGYNLVRVGERSGELPSMLHSLGKLCENSGRVRMKQFLALLEPAAILVIGGMVGLIMIGIVLAITSANDIVAR